VARERVKPVNLLGRKNKPTSIEGKLISTNLWTASNVNKQSRRKNVVHGGDMRRRKTVGENPSCERMRGWGKNRWGGKEVLNEMRGKKPALREKTFNLARAARGLTRVPRGKNCVVGGGKHT